MTTIGTHEMGDILRYFRQLKKEMAAVILIVYDKSRSECAKEVYNWLASIHVPTLPSQEISDPKTSQHFEATWSPNGHVVHIKAWVAENTENFAEWEGVIHIYPEEAVIISRTPNAIASSSALLAQGRRCRRAILCPQGRDDRFGGFGSACAASVLSLES